FAVGFCRNAIKFSCVRRIGTSRGDPDSAVVPWQAAHLKPVMNRVLPRSALPLRLAVGFCAKSADVRIVANKPDSQICFIPTSPAKRRRRAPGRLAALVPK